jgi:hypothetical protein
MWPSPSHEQPAKQATPVTVAQRPAIVQAPAPKLVKQPTDSGYHGSTEDEMDVDARLDGNDAPIENNAETAATTNIVKSPSDGRRTTEGSFHSAQEAITTTLDAIAANSPVVNSAQENQSNSPPTPEEKSSPFREHTEPNNKQDGTKHPLDTIMGDQFDDIGSPSDGSTPDRPLIRKSSHTFPSLPPREPL